MSVKAILADHDSPAVLRFEKEIDEMVYALYGLTPEEIAIVEGRGAVFMIYGIIFQ